MARNDKRLLRTKRPKPKKAKPKSRTIPQAEVASNAVVVPKAGRPKTNTARKRAGAALAQGVLTATKAVALRVQSYSFDEIGAHLGISGEGARKAVERGLHQTIVASKEKADVLRAEEDERLRWLLSHLREKVIDGDPKAIAEARAISARLSALHGLDAPTRTELSGKDGRPIEHVVGTFADILASAMAEPEKAEVVIDGTARPALVEGGAGPSQPAEAESAGEGEE